MLLDEGPSMGKKKCSVFLSVLIIFTYLISVSIAAGGEHRKLISRSQGPSTKELSVKYLQEDGHVLHHRILTIKTDDYGNYQPTPSLSKPPSKLIPNRRL
ncbi:hypothetical protein HPP92_010634 [Vanilla planifolia]|nr:hypothetical protein HPP92_010634 [Vanilla planifolia]